MSCWCWDRVSKNKHLVGYWRQHSCLYQLAFRLACHVPKPGVRPLSSFVPVSCQLTNLQTLDVLNLSTLVVSNLLLSASLLLLRWGRSPRKGFCSVVRKSLILCWRSCVHCSFDGRSFEISIPSTSCACRRGWPVHLSFACRNFHRIHSMAIKFGQL